MAWKTTSRDSKTDVPLAKSQFNLDILSNPYVLTNAQLKQLLKSKCITVEDDTSREVLLSQCLKFIAPRPQRSPRTSRRGYRLHQQFQLQNKQHQQQQQHPSEAYSKQSLNDHSHQQETRQLNFSRAKKLRNENDQSVSHELRTKKAKRGETKRIFPKGTKVVTSQKIATERTMSSSSNIIKMS
eukprot:gene4666-8611_t